MPFFTFQASGFGIATSKLFSDDAVSSNVVNQPTREPLQYFFILCPPGGLTSRCCAIRTVDGEILPTFFYGILCPF
jgi:hypothetical protein